MGFMRQCAAFLFGFSAKPNHARKCQQDNCQYAQLLAQVRHAEHAVQTMPDEFKAQIQPIGKGRNRNPLQKRQGKRGQISIVAVSSCLAIRIQQARQERKRKGDEQPAEKIVCRNPEKRIVEADIVPVPEFQANGNCIKAEIKEQSQQGIAEWTRPRFEMQFVGEANRSQQNEAPRQRDIQRHITPQHQPRFSVIVIAALCADSAKHIPMLEQQGIADSANKWQPVGTPFVDRPNERNYKRRVDSNLGDGAYSERVHNLIIPY